MATLAAHRLSLPRRPAVRNVTWGDDELRRARLGHGDLVVEDGGNVLFGIPFERRLKLNYGFAGVEELRAGFGGLLRRLLAQGRAGERFDRLEIDFTDAPRRPYVEPVLRNHGFEPGDEWLRLTCLDLTAAAAASVGRSPVTVLAAGAGEGEAVVDLLTSVLGDAPAGPAFLVSGAEADLHTVLARDADGALVGAAVARTTAHGVGAVEALGVVAGARRSDAGRALLHHALTWLAGQGTRRVETAVPSGDSDMLRLFRSAGFTPQGAGLTYRRDLP